MITLILLSILVLLHELGHFLAARKFGVKVEEFGIGLPPRALTITKRNGTEYTLNWLPIGGFVRLYGEDGDLSWWEKLSKKKKKESFAGIAGWKRAIILVSGVGMNFLIGTLLFSIIYSWVGIPKTVGEQVLVAKVAEGSPAERAGLTPGSVLKQVGDEKVESADEFVELVGEKKGEILSLYVNELRSDGTLDDSMRQVSLLARENPPEGEGSIGVEIVTYPIIEYEKKAWYLAPIYGAVEGVKEAYGWTSYMVELVMHPSQLWQGVVGPAKVVQMGQEQAREGWISFLRFGGIISFNLAVFNLLPLPALDGGRIVFLVIERVLGKKRTMMAEKWVHGVGMLLLILLLIVVTIRDLL